MNILFWENLLFLVLFNMFLISSDYEMNYQFSDNLYVINNLITICFNSFCLFTFFAREFLMIRSLSNILNVYYFYKNNSFIRCFAIFDVF